MGIIEKLLNRGLTEDPRKVKQAADEKAAQYEKDVAPAPEEEGLIEDDFIPNMDTEQQKAGMVMAAMPNFRAKAQMPIKAEHERQWIRALESSKDTPGAYETLLRKGKAAFVQELVDSEKQGAKQLRREVRDSKEKVRSNKQTAESVDYGSTSKDSARFGEGAGTFQTSTPTTNIEPSLTLRKKK